MPPSPRPAEERFLAKVDKTDTCWIWTGAKRTGGYGQFYFDGRTCKAHRFSYEFYVGPIPNGAQIDHRCRVRACVNPDHLRPVSNKENQENLSGARRDSRSGVRGVYWHKRDKLWYARLGHNGKRVHVGLFARLEDAETAVIAKRNEIFTHNSGDRRGLSEDPACQATEDFPDRA